MNPCNEILAQMAFYLDDELQGDERAAVEMHLSACGPCREMLESERRFLRVVRGARPLYRATPELRARVEELLDEAPAPHEASRELLQRIERSLSGNSAAASRPIDIRRAVSIGALLALALLACIWSLAGYSNRLGPKPPSDFAMMAVETHQRYLRGQLPLEIASGVPEQISAWFAGKVPFILKLPNYQELSGQEKLYQLEGARLAGYKNDYAAYVAYQMHRRQISLVVTSDTVAHPSGGEEIASKGITFHYDSIEGLKVITWSDRGLTYALVSDLEERGQQSCIVCHQGTRDRDFIESLKP
ncbi:MAG TPA: zf-HC2 domain-containing protein [Blastocatellia bacterium]|nr:zf-HC2 domain-containing protein [Blastocatellia bacterium]